MSIYDSWFNLLYIFNKILKNKEWGDSAVVKEFVLHATDSGSVHGTPHEPLSTNRSDP